jgi:hypothetical protein
MCFLYERLKNWRNIAWKQEENKWGDVKFWHVILISTAAGFCRVEPYITVLVCVCVCGALIVIAVQYNSVPVYGSPDCYSGIVSVCVIAWLK